MRRWLKYLGEAAKGAIEPSMQYIEPRFFMLSGIAVLGYPLYYFVWHDLFPQPYENLPLRLVGGIIFMPFMLVNHWPKWLRRYMPIYWYLVILFALPFFFTFMMLMNGGTTVWVSSALVAIFLMILLLNGYDLFIQLVLGVSLALLAAHLMGAPEIQYSVYLIYLPVFLFALIAGLSLNFGSNMLQSEKLRAMLAIASNIAHEMRTPLLGIKAGAAGLNRHLPSLISGYKVARQAGLPVPQVREAHLDAMRGVLERIESEADYSNVFIDMLLMNARMDGAQTAREVCSMAACVEKALQRYPFVSERQRSLVHWEPGEDFMFLGDELMVVHVLFNLLKNALFHIAKAGKGEISIRLERTATGNILRFSDTGTGIPPEVLPHVFARFYSWSSDGNHGEAAGIGLAFCRDVMDGLGGGIAVKSALGEYTEFILTFPNAEAA